MKLTYRGNSYEMPAPMQSVSDSTDRPKIKLTYRGSIYYSTPHPVVVSEANRDSKTVTLTYRGNTYDRQLSPPQPNQSSLAINWRYQSQLGGYTA